MKQLTGICANVYKLRMLSGLTQDQFGEIAHVSRAAVSQWEGGRAEPRMGAIEYLRMHFGIRKADLIEEGGMDNAYLTSSGRIAFRESDAPELSKDELTLIKLYRSTDARGKAAIMRTAEGEAGVEREFEASVNL